MSGPRHRRGQAAVIGTTERGVAGAVSRHAMHGRPYPEPLPASALGGGAAAGPMPMLRAATGHVTGTGTRRGAKVLRITAGVGRDLVLLMIVVAAVHTDAITFPCIAPLLGPTIPSAPSREPSPARSRTPDGGPQNPPQRLTIRGGDLAASKTPRTQSDYTDSSGIGSAEESSIGDVAQKLAAMTIPRAHQVLNTGTRVMLRFRINYSTRWGENVIIVGSTEELGDVQDASEDEVRSAIAAGKGKVMRYIADGNWEFATLMPSAPTQVFCLPISVSAMAAHHCL